MSEVRCVAPTGCQLGEGPLWSPSEAFLWWVDIKRAKLHRYNPKTGNTRRYDLPLHASAMVLSDGQLLMVGDAEVGLYDPSTEDYRKLHGLDAELETNRTNDGGLAPDGSFWFGTMCKNESGPKGRYYRLTKTGSLTTVDIDSVTVPNSFVFSPCGNTFYTNDSSEQEMLAFDYDRQTGALSGKRLFSSTVSEGCYPDGSAVDAEGYIWNAQWAGSRIVRYTPDGAVDRIVKMPVSRPTSCAFGGPDLKTLYITSARTGLSDAALDRQPLAGCLFALDVAVPGLGVREWGQPL